MNLFADIHKKLIKSLLEEGVDFIIIGGYSVIYYGYQRSTGDVDILLKPENSNKDKLLLVLKKTGIAKELLEEIASLDFTGYLVFNIWEKPERVDFITRINLVGYEEADREKVLAEIDGMKIPFIHLNHLILSKINTGRLKDKADIEMLQKILAQMKK